MSKDLELLLRDNVLCPKMFSFDQVRKIVKEAVKLEREEVLKEIGQEIRKYRKTHAGLVALSSAWIEIKNKYLDNLRRL